MLKIIGIHGNDSKVAPMADGTRSGSPVSVEEFDIVVDDLSSWEFIDPSDDDEDNYSFSDDGLRDDDDDAEVDSSKEKDPLAFGSPASDISMESLSAALAEQIDVDIRDVPHDLPVDLPLLGGVYHADHEIDVGAHDVAHDLRVDLPLLGGVYHSNRDDEEDADHYENGDEEEEDDYDGYDLDDELVPRWVSGKFGRQRIRKLGKRAYPRMNKSKRLPYHYNRPGCVHGKHGLGVQHSYI